MYIFVPPIFGKKVVLALAVVLLSISNPYAQESNLEALHKTPEMIFEQKEKAVVIADHSLGKEELEVLRELSEERAVELQKELSLTREQTKKMALKIYKFSIKAYEILQSKKDTYDKSRALYGIAANQQDEIKEILSYNQYHYFKRRIKNIEGTNRR